KNVRMSRCASCAEDRFGFVDKNERHETFFSFLARRSKNPAPHSFRFPTPHVQDLGTFDVHKIFTHFGPGFFAELLRQIECSRLADKRLPAAWRTVKQKTFRRSMLKFLEKIRMQERQLDRVLDRLQRRFLAADFFPW